MKTLNHKFVEFIPENISENCVYVSLDYSTAVHKCCCGCSEEVVTPLSPNDWKLIFNGETISLYPSIGNWSFECKSHYFIRNNDILWAERWSKKEIEVGRLEDKKNKMSHYNNRIDTSLKSPKKPIVDKKRSFWNWLIGKKTH